jgi:hypothetical protein
MERIFSKKCGGVRASGDLHAGRAFGELAMWMDEIVEETRKAREEYAAQFDFAAIYEDLKRQEKQSARKIVSLPPREPELSPQAKAS